MSKYKSFGSVHFDNLVDFHTQRHMQMVVCWNKHIIRLFSLSALLLASVNLSAQNFKEKEIKADIIQFQKTLYELERQVERTYVLIREWVFIEKADSTPSKVELLVVLKNDPITDFYDILIGNSQILPQEQLDKLIDISNSIQTLRTEVQYITSQLNSFVSYDDPFVMFDVMPKVEAGGEVSIAAEEIKHTINLLRFYCDDLLKQEKLKPIIESNVYSQGVKRLVVQLFETCNILGEINKYLSGISTYGYYYGDEEKLMIKNGVYKKLVTYYATHYEYEELQELLTFYKSDLGIKILETNGFLSLRLIESVVNSELKYR